MAFNFLGTFTTGQLEQLVTFAKIQETEINDRKKFLLRKISEVGVFTTEYDEETKYPVKYSVSDSSYAGKLLQAYKALGGNPEKEFILRTRDQPVFLVKGNNLNTRDPQDTASGFSDLYSNGRRYRGNQRFDRDVAVLVEKLKKWQLESIKRKRELLEYKIKRSLDYADELQLEYDVLDAMVGTGSELSVSSQVARLTRVMTRTGAANVINDLSDVFGFNIGKPGDPNFGPDIDQSEGKNLRL